MSDADGLREQAQRAYRLAKAINNREVIARLRAFALELEARASELEQHSGGQEGPPDREPSC